jgi:hypothetical protein
MLAKRVIRVGCSLLVILITEADEISSRFFGQLGFF